MTAPPPTKPQTVFNWATSDFAHKPAPPLEKRRLGWVGHDEPPEGWLNWFFGGMSEWSQWLDDSFNDYQVPKNLLVRAFGNGIDGDVTITSTTTLTRDMFYRNLTFDGGNIQTNGYRVYVQNTLDMTNAGAKAFLAHAALASNPGTGTAGQAGGTAGAGASAGGAGTYGAAGAGANGGAGQTTNGSNGSNGGAVTSYIGGIGGAAGAGFAGSSGSGGTAGAAGTQTTDGTKLDTLFPPFVTIGSGGLVRTTPASGGGGGGGGGGNGTAGGGGGGGGAGAGIIHVCARKIIRGGFAPYVFWARGGNGGAGGNPANSARGSGGGGGGGGGGFIFIVYAELDGEFTAGDACDASGGAGGAGGASSGSRSGAGGSGGRGGFITILDLGGSRVLVDGAAGSAGGAGGSGTGGTAGAGGACTGTF